VATQPVTAPKPVALVTPSAVEAPPPAAAPDPSRIQIGDTVLVPAHSSLRTSRSTISLPTDLRLRVVDVRGDHVGCLLRYADGDEAIAWVDRSLAVRAWQHGVSPAMPPVPGAAPPRSNEPLQHVGLTAAAPAPAVRSQPSVYGSSIITFDNQSGEPALVRLVGPTQEGVYVANGGQGSIRRVAPGVYAIYIRYGAAGAYRWTRGEYFTVQEVGLSYSNIAITLHTVPSGNYRYRESSEAEFNQAFR
jgi:hypothetical protein